MTADKTRPDRSGAAQYMQFVGAISFLFMRRKFGRAAESAVVARLLLETLAAAPQHPVAFDHLVIQRHGHGRLPAHIVRGSLTDNLWEAGMLLEAVRRMRD